MSKGVLTMLSIQTKRDLIRKAIQSAYDVKELTRTEYDLLWDLTTNGNLPLAETYLRRAIKDSRAE
jgi:hypothetical protein